MRVAPVVVSAVQRVSAGAELVKVADCVPAVEQVAPAQADAGAQVPEHTTAADRQAGRQASKAISNSKMDQVHLRCGAGPSC